MTLLALTLAMMTSLAPGRDHDVLARAIVSHVESDPRLFANDDDGLRSSGLYVALLFRESSLRNDAVGDGGRSHCAGQVYLPNDAKTREGWSGADLRGDADKCLTVVSRMLRASIGACWAFPVETRLSVYARGRCDSAEGQRLSRDRIQLGDKLFRDVSASARTGSLFLFQTTAHASRASLSHDVADRTPFGPFVGGAS